jgi:hypothetical protein
MEMESAMKIQTRIESQPFRHYHGAVFFHCTIIHLSNVLFIKKILFYVPSILIIECQTANKKKQRQGGDHSCALTHGLSNPGKEG